MKEQEFKRAVEQINISDTMQMRILEKVKVSQKTEVRMKSKKKIIAVAVAATFLIGATVFAATSKWSSGFMQNLRISGSQMEHLQNSESNLVAMPHVSDTQNGITVSTAQCLYDGNVMRMSFYVEGYELDPTQTPELEYLVILLDGEQGHNYDWNFYDGIDWTDRKNPVMADGSPVLEDENGNYIPNYRIADGKMEIDLNWQPFVDNAGHLSAEELANKTITILMKNFGDVKGQWELEWNLGSLEKGTEFALNTVLGDTGATVEEVTLYSASAIVNYDFPYTEVLVDAYDENGHLSQTTDFAEPPALVGVRLKDGTVISELNDGGSAGYEKDDKTFVARISFSGILDVSEIDALLFEKSDSPSEGVALTEENCYMVALH